MAEEIARASAVMTGLGRASIIGIARGSNPCRGAARFGYQLAVLFCLRAARCGTPVMPNNSKVFAGADLSGWKGGFVGVRAQPPGFTADPTFSLANSPVSPVDRLRLLTAPSNLAAQGSGFPTRLAADYDGIE